jgi:subfamily B ATP-binding cassette protein MsbA
VLLAEEREDAGSGKPDIGPVRGAISFRGVSFAHPGRRETLHGIDLDIAAGETVAITGRNGAGKSTLVHLVLRLHEPSLGCILVDGKDIAGVSLQSLRRAVGLVPQQVLLLNTSVRENIGIGREGAEAHDIEAAARAAGAHDFVSTLPQGYDTIIGDQGVRLSGGERQRLALARALLKDPPILILDEATAMFDPEAERDFVERCRQTCGTRTLLIITHRPASISLADRVIVLDGRVREVPAPRVVGWR